SLQTPDARLPHIESEAAHGKGWFEVQDEASQLAALLTGAEPGLQVADICAGAGGKTLALAAAMQNKGQIHAWDRDKHRLRPIWERLKRAGARNVQVLPGGEAGALDPLAGKMDIVLADAPCTGTGSWRRKPDAKWRLGEQMLQTRSKEQRDVLKTAARLVKPGGKLVYVTCSLLPEENMGQINRFLAARPDFLPENLESLWKKLLPDTPPPLIDGKTKAALLLSPARQNTDGFFIAAMRKKE
ncbi:MAG TPA: RsmB/NOP family class I SAM-dependent RNA methyltransferase, partial [Rhizobiales bacterium]|nr:RsmB/NOP family class I SAM-dependent RNA methyltransferase [Hyphomicrobiales bacterium]